MIQPNDLRIGNSNLEWRKFRDLDNYLISENGDVLNVTTKRVLKTYKAKNKYPRVSIPYKGKQKTFCIHKLVAESFIPNPLSKITVNHKDCNKHNNHVSNLEWATISENVLHAVQNGLIVPPSFEGGETHPAAKLSNVDIAMIKVLLKHDFTQRQIAKRFNIHECHISQIKLGKTWKHIYTH